MNKPGIFSLGRSAALILALGLADAFAPSTEPLLLEGEPGSGKNCLARYIHHCARAEQPFVDQQLPTLSDSLQKDTLFGHVRGAFTDAVRDSRGLLHEAHRGTLFLDELGDATPATQALLLRVMESGTFRRLGEAKDTHVSVRVIAATNANLDSRITEGSFRQDLLDRFGPFRITLPPLRERKDEILPRFRRFLAETYDSSPEGSEKQLPELAPDTAALLEAGRWPGNLRQLRQEAQYVALMVRAGTIILPRHLSEQVEVDGESALSGATLAVTQRQVRRRREVTALKAAESHTIASLGERLQLSRRRTFQLLAQPRFARGPAQQEAIEG